MQERMAPRYWKRQPSSERWTIYWFLAPTIGTDQHRHVATPQAARHARTIVKEENFHRTHPICRPCLLLVRINVFDEFRQCLSTELRKGSGEGDFGYNEDGIRQLWRSQVGRRRCLGTSHQFLKRLPHLLCERWRGLSSAVLWRNEIATAGGYRRGQGILE